MAGARVAVGFTVKSGWASAVLLRGPVSAPRVLHERRIELSDPALPDAKQPYHAGFGTARARGPELERLVESVKRFGRETVTDCIAAFARSDGQLRGAGIVVGSLVDPATIANDHIRIHALEGQLFRSVVQEAAERNGLACSIWRERDLYGWAADVLARSEPNVRDALAALRPASAPAWRAEHKTAALAAWLVLAGCQGRPAAKRVRAAATI